jgi:hypothetical protein
MSVSGIRTRPPKWKLSFVVKTKAGESVLTTVAVPEAFARAVSAHGGADLDVQWELLEDETSRTLATGVFGRVDGLKGKASPQR